MKLTCCFLPLRGFTSRGDNSFIPGGDVGREKRLQRRQEATNKCAFCQLDVVDKKFLVDLKLIGENFFLN